MVFFDGLFKKKEAKTPRSEEFYAYAEGNLIPVGEVSDSTFAEELLGKSAAIVPNGNILYAPADATISVVLDTKHAVGMVTKSGAEVLLHIGVDTVSLNGECFETKVKVGDKVKKGDILVEFDREAIIAKGYDTVIPMIITNCDNFSSFKKRETGEVNCNKVVMSISK